MTSDVKAHLYDLYLCTNGTQEQLQVVQEYCVKDHAARRALGDPEIWAEAAVVLAQAGVEIEDITEHLDAVTKIVGSSTTAFGPVAGAELVARAVINLRVTEPGALGMLPNFIDAVLMMQEGRRP